MTTIRNWIVALLGTMLFTNCYQNKTDQKITAGINTEMVLSIGKINISAYEFEKNTNTPKPQFIQQTLAGSQNKLFNKRKQDFINKAYFLADAYDKGYYNSTHVDSIVEGAARFMVSQSNGLLEQEINKEYKISNDALEKAIERSTKEIHIEYLKFKDKNTALKNMQGLLVNSSSTLKKLIDKVNFLDVTYKKEVLTWPFKGYWGKEEEIFALKKDEVSPLLKLYNGYYIIHVENISELRKPIITADQMKVKLMIAERQKTKDLLNVKMYSNARPTIDENSLSVFTQKLNNYVYGPNHTFLKADFRDILSKTMLTYTSPVREKKIITVNNFIDYYNTLFIKGDVKNDDDVSRNLIALCFSDYAYAESKKRGVTTQPQFLLDKNNFKNNVIYNLYTQQELANNGVITQNEIIQAYNLMKPRLMQARDVVVSVYYFNNQEEAIRKKFNLKSDTLTFKGLTKEVKHLLVNYKSNVLPDTLKKAVFDLNVRVNPARMMELNNKYIVIVKEKESGSRVRKLAEVKDLLIAEIKNKRLIENQKIKLIELKNKYKPTIDLVGATSSNLALN